MARGGARPNSGRKPGPRDKTKHLLIARSKQAALNATITPLEYLMEVLQDPNNDRKERFQAAIAAAPYVHPRLSNSTVTTTIKKSVDELTTAEIIAALQQDANAEGASEAEGSHSEPDQVH